MSGQNLFREGVFAPIILWAQVEEALIHITTPETKLALIPAVMEDLKNAAGDPRTFLLTLATHAALLGDASYTPAGEANTGISAMP